MTQSKKIKWLSISDIHLGNLRTPADFILANLRRELFDTNIIPTLDLLIIAGDLFDRLLEYNHPSATNILLFIDKLMILCSTHNVKLRVLEGTPSHDNKQNIIFDALYATGNYSCDMKYFDTLTIEYIQDWDVRVLYVPDKIRTTTNEVYKDTLELLKNQAIEQVDFAIMHGAFSHQLPPMAKEVYIPEDWLKIVKHYIFVGHVHFHSIFKRILAGGSFDRMAQGEEKPKGYLVGTMNLHGVPKKDEAYFIENKNAKKYITIELFEDDLQNNLKLIEDKVKDLPNESFIRIKADKGNPVFANMVEISKINLSHFWSKDEKLLEEPTIEITEEIETWEAIHIDKSNIESIIMQRLSIQNVSGEILSLATNFLQEAL